jgi:hypothetical protein
MLADAHAARTADVAVIAISASEIRKMANLSAISRIFRLTLQRYIWLT